MPKTIVIADDEIDALNILRDILESESYRVFAVPDGKSAIETVLKEKPDLLVVDNSMPEIEGREVCRRLRANKDLKGLKMLIMSAEFGLADAVAAGADAFIPKPFDIDQLLDAVKKLL